MSNISSLNSVKSDKFDNSPIVFLKSGSPPLCVRYYAKQSNQPALITVDWFLEGDHFRDTFLETQLVFEEEQK